MLARMRRKGNPPTLYMGPLWKTAWRCLKKLKIELAYDPVIIVLDIYPKDTNVA